MHGASADPPLVAEVIEHSMHGTLFRHVLKVPVN